jgi:hypothetical protein
MENEKQEVTLESIINILINGIELAQKRGAYSLQESTALYNTIMNMKELFEKKNKPKEEETLTV